MRLPGGLGGPHAHIASSLLPGILCLPPWGPAGSSAAPSLLKLQLRLQVALVRASPASLLSSAVSTSVLEAVNSGWL